MGLTIHSLGEMPPEVSRGYYLYLLDYGWREPLGEALRENFDQMADLASRNDAAVIRGTGVHFNNDVFSWHHINGQEAEELLPAILITNKHPHAFFDAPPETFRVVNENLLLIPLKNICKNTSEFVEVIRKIFSDIKNKKALSDFRVARTLKKGKLGALMDALILEPSIGGLGLDLKKIPKMFESL